MCPLQNPPPHWIKDRISFFGGFFLQEVKIVQNIAVFVQKKGFYLVSNFSRDPGFFFPGKREFQIEDFPGNPGTGNPGNRHYLFLWVIYLVPEVEFFFLILDEFRRL